MLKLNYLAFFIWLLALPTQNTLHSATYQYINGEWFTGKTFEKKVMYSINGTWSTSANGKVDSVIDLHHKFIVPPFAEAHTHYLEGIGDFDERIRGYLKDGVFYVKNPNNIRVWTDKLSGKINTHKSLDASFANGGLTSTGGHPERLYEEHLRPQLGDIPAGWFNGKAYFTIDSENDLNEKWPLIKAGKPDFIKTYLANTEYSGKTPPPSVHPMRKGLDPAILLLIVAKAHAEGYRVTTHIETTADFRTALMAGVDEINHTPGFYLDSPGDTARYRLTPQDAKLAAEKNIIVVTALLSRSLTEDRSLLPLVERTQKYNLKLLAAAGVRLAIGSDHAKTPVDEIKALQRLNIFDNLSLLKMWCETSAVAIFPGRKIGKLLPDYEASFLALDGNPLNDFSNTEKISVRCKQGHFIELK